MITVAVTIHTDEEYDHTCKLVRASPGWMWLDIDENGDEFEGGDPMANFTVCFDTDSHAMWFKLKMGT